MQYIFWDLLGNALFAPVGDWLTCARGVGWVCGAGVFFSCEGSVLCVWVSCFWDLIMVCLWILFFLINFRVDISNQFFAVGCLSGHCELPWSINLTNKLFLLLLLFFFLVILVSHFLMKHPLKITQPVWTLAEIRRSSILNFQGVLEWYILWAKTLYASMKWLTRMQTT